MRGGYDLYGTYYQSETDALNAETAQMAQIDAGIANRKLAQQEIEARYSDAMTDLRFAALEQRVKQLENLLGVAAPSTEGPEERKP